MFLIPSSLLSLPRRLGRLFASFLQSAQFWTAAFRDAFLLSLFIIYTYMGLAWSWVFPPKPKSLKGETVLVTGSASGIGRQICLCLARVGVSKLICWDINRRENLALVVELKALGIDASEYEVDIGDLRQVQLSAAKVKDEVGDVSILINAAGIMPVHSFLSHNPREVTRTFSVITFGPLWVLREFLPGLIRRGRGHVVTICSFAGLTGGRNLVAFAGAEAGLNGAVESVKEEVRMLKKVDIKFTTVYPSSCTTDLGQSVVRSRFPWLLPEMTKPDYVAEKTLEGILMDREYVFIPAILNFLTRVIKVGPSRIYYAINDFFSYYVEPCENTRVVGIKSD